MTTRDGCIEGQQPPDLEKGDTVTRGRFLRNLKKKGEATKRYPGDNDENPLYGLKLSTKFWKNASGNGDMSINEQACVSSDVCSIEIHPNSQQYYHVAVLNLAEINRVMGEHIFVAQYLPLKDPPHGPNACHFELLPLNGSTQSLFALQTELDKPFPPGKMPDGNDNEIAAKTATAEYQEIVVIRRWVRNQNGALSPNC
ncbi:hypothetical protein [Rosistilla oblonga]|uniref:Uncharacterized protein n=1 Tax=Rosistilla oblonga TaxID=2527990 RepID=A0A518IV90_9BACT|nr:hypothetical protein [Rosistilla oblonga]QDV56998.1 hypothetical protein Mal33_29990 [Rosistilla oblonga]